MDELVESEIFERELEEIIGMFCLNLTRRCKFIRNLEVLIEDCFDSIGDSPAEDILGV